MEILDLYDKNGKRINKTIIRGEPIKDDEYCMAVDIWIKNDKHQILITQRHQSKTYPEEWECTSGFILSGENSISGALREVEEEQVIQFLSMTTRCTVYKPHYGVALNKTPFRMLFLQRLILARTHQVFAHWLELWLACISGRIFHLSFQIHNLIITHY